jgi:holo-[acyl-carrier protein] synthase
MIIGIGVDAVDVMRFGQMLERTPGTRARIFTPEELAYAESQVNPVPSLAVRFAAREAVMKALGVGLGAFDFHDIWVRRRDSGEPEIIQTGRAAILADQRGVRNWMISLTHTEHTAIAYVMCFGDHPDDPSGD